MKNYLFLFLVLLNISCKSYSDKAMQDVVESKYKSAIYNAKQKGFLINEDSFHHVIFDSLQGDYQLQFYNIMQLDTAIEYYKLKK